MADTYRIWIEIERKFNVGEETEDHEDVGESEPLDMEFTTPEAAEAIRTMMLGMMDAMSTYIVQTYAPVYARVEKLEGLLDYHDWSWRDHERETPTGEGKPNRPGGDLGQGGGGEAGPGENPTDADPGAEGTGLSGTAGCCLETELTREELDFLDAHAEDGPGPEEDVRPAGVEYFRAGRLT